MQAQIDVSCTVIRRSLVPCMCHSDIQLHPDVVAEPPFVVSRRPLKRRMDVVFVAPSAERSAAGARYRRGLAVAVSPLTARPAVTALEPAVPRPGGCCVCV